MTVIHKRESENANVLFCNKQKQYLRARIGQDFLTFIVPTFNSERTIGQCLSSIPVSDEIKVIAVNNLSSDSTLASAANTM